MDRKELLEEAIKVTTVRGISYGTPEDNFDNIATLWTPYVTRVVGDGPIKPVDVALLMILMKVARLMNEPGHKDSWVDIAGYAACGAQIAVEKPAEKAEPAEPMVPRHIDPGGPDLTYIAGILVRPGIRVRETSAALPYNTIRTLRQGVVVKRDEERPQYWWIRWDHSPGPVLLSTREFWPMVADTPVETPPTAAEWEDEVRV